MKNQMYIALLVLPLLAGCGNKKEAAHTMPAPEISVSRPSIQDITLTKNYPGYLTSEKTVDLVGRVSGTLQTVAYTPGSRVHQGQVLFQIEPTVYQDNVRQAEAALNTALMAPKQEVNLEAGEKNVMSVDIPTFQYKTRTADENDIYSYGFAFTSGDLDGAVKSLADVLPDMIRLAECEKACQLMAAEIEKTRRRVNALEHVIIPETEQSIKYITMKLDENERSTQIRLMKVKDMMLEETHHYSEK